MHSLERREMTRVIRSVIKGEMQREDALQCENVITFVGERSWPGKARTKESLERSDEGSGW